MALSEKDNIEAYLVTFERIMEAYKVPKSEWKYHLAHQLTGRAQHAFAALPGDNAGVYEELKAAIYSVTTSMKNLIDAVFKETVRENGESNRAYAIRLLDLESKWLRECDTVEKVKEAIGLEQFLKTLPQRPETGDLC